MKENTKQLIDMAIENVKENGGTIVILNKGDKFRITYKSNEVLVESCGYDG